MKNETVIPKIGEWEYSDNDATLNFTTQKGVTGTLKAREGYRFRFQYESNGSLIVREVKK